MGCLSYADCIAAATADSNNAALVAGDKEFEQLEKDLGYFPGNKIGSVISKVEIVGGVVLIGIGVKILIEHLIIHWKNT